MAGNITNYAELKILDHVTGRATFTKPGSTVLALLTTAPTADDGSGAVEVSGGAYARQTITWAVAAAGAISNSADLTFPTATANWGTILAVAIYDDAGTPNMLWYGNLTTSKTVNNGDIFKITTGNLTLTLD